MIQVLLNPDAVSMVGSMNAFEIYNDAKTDVVFILSYADSKQVIVQHTYTPNDKNRITIKVKDIILPLLSFHLKDTDEVYAQDDIIKTFQATIYAVDAAYAKKQVNFSVIRAGVDSLADSATNFLRGNFLTWQPNVKAVTYYSPEFLTYYAQSTCVVKCRAYLWSGAGYEEKTVTVATLNAGKVYTIPVQYAIIAKLIGGNVLPSYYDVWVESTSGYRRTYQQRYYADDQKSEEEEWFLFENSLGGIDCFRAYGNSENTAEHTHNVVEIEEDSEEYRVDTARKYKKHTGYLDSKERQWLLDFFPSLGKYHYQQQAIRKITVTESDVNWDAKELPSDYSFTYKYADARPYLNLGRTDTELKEMAIHVPDLGNFTIAPRLVEFPRITLSGGALFPVQNPYSEEWGTTTLDALYSQLVAQLADSYKGGGGIGHTHNNYDLLEHLTERLGYILYRNERLKAGYADVAGDFSADGAAAGKILRKDTEDQAKALITFLKGLKVGMGDHGINENGRADLSEVVVDRVRDHNSTEEQRTIIGAQGFDMYLDENGKSHLYIDDLAVRNKLFASAMEIRQVSYAGGTTIFSNAGSTIAKVAHIFDAKGEKVIAYKCYAKADDGTTATANWWKPGMMGLCQTFNIKAGVYDGVQNRYYWRLCIGAGQEYLDDGKLYDYFTLSNLENFAGQDGVQPDSDPHILANELGELLQFDGVLVSIVSNNEYTSFADVLASDGITKDDGGTDAKTRRFYGYDPNSNAAPAVGDVVVNVGDQVRWNKYGNVIKLSTSVEDGSGDTAPSIAMYHGIGAPRRISSSETGTSVWQWKEMTSFTSPIDVMYNAKNFRFVTYTDDGDMIDVGSVYDAYELKGSYSSVVRATDGSYTPALDSIAFSLSHRVGNHIEDIQNYTLRGIIEGKSYVLANKKLSDLSSYLKTAKIVKLEALVDGETKAAIDYPVMADGAKGDKGDKGEDGSDGKDGVDGKDGNDGTSVTVIEQSVQYAISDSATVAPSSWSNGVVAATDDKPYLWTKTTVMYSDGNSTVSYSVGYKGKNGIDGKDGVDGKDAVNIIVNPAVIIYNTDENGNITSIANKYATISAVKGGKTVNFSFVGDPVVTNCFADYPSAHPGRVEITSVVHTSVKSTDGTSKSIPHTSGSVKCTLNVQGLAFVVTIPFQVSMNAFMGRVYWNNKELSASFTNLKNDLEKDSPDILKAFGGNLMVSAAQNMFSNYSGMVDADGKIIKTSESGLITMADFAGLFASAFTEKQGVVKSEISAFITEDDAGKLISNATIEADKINLSGHTMAFTGKQITIDTDNFKLDASGNVNMTGKINATSGKIGVFMISPDGYKDSLISGTWEDDNNPDVSRFTTRMQLSKNLFEMIYKSNPNLGDVVANDKFCRVSLSMGTTTDSLLNPVYIKAYASGSQTAAIVIDSEGGISPSYAIYARSGTFAGLRLNYHIGSDSYTINNHDHFILNTATNDNTVYTLPSPADSVGQVIFIANKYNYACVVKGSIYNRGYASAVTVERYGMAIFISDGYHWIFKWFKW